MEDIDATARIRAKFARTGSPAQVPLLRPTAKRHSFEALLDQEGVYVDNLANLPFLPWNVFSEAVCLLKRKGGTAMRGDAMKGRLGDRYLPLDSLEGHIAHVVYRVELGSSVFRRATPIVCILIWAGICEVRHPGWVSLVGW